ncbi:hypothetical protein BANRA_01972 [Escherichia coli]|nr:hypothetical protein BANRA_01972 [Escherichia coli]
MKVFSKTSGVLPAFQGVWQITQQATEIGVILHHGAQGGFADVAALEELLHEADGGFLVARSRLRSAGRCGRRSRDPVRP